MSTKDFKQGMVAGAKPFGDKLDQLASVSEGAVSDLKEGLAGVTEVAYALVDDVEKQDSILSAYEKKRIYDLDDATDISALEDEEKEFLVAVLTELANAISDVSDLQKKYLLSVCSVANIPTTQTSLNLACIENVENMKTQKILLRHVMEFLFIGDQDYDFLDRYENELFCYFSVNKRGITEIKETINRVYNAMGIDGIANRYTFTSNYQELCVEQESDECAEEVAEDETEQFIDSAEYEEQALTGLISVQDELSYQYKKLTINATCAINGKLTFTDCVILIGSEASFNVVGSLTFKNCAISYASIRSKDSYVITSTDGATVEFKNCAFKELHFFINAESDVLIEECTLNNCNNFVYAHSYSTKYSFRVIDCYVVADNTLLEGGGANPFALERILGAREGHGIFSVSNFESFEARNLNVVAPHHKTEKLRLFDVHCYNGVIENSRLESAIIYAPEAKVNQCTIEMSIIHVSSVANSQISQSEVSCDYNPIDRCDFTNMQNGNTITAKGLTNCTFNNVGCKSKDFITTTASIVNCIFSNVNVKDGRYLIKAVVDYGLGDKKQDISLKNCRFVNCYTDRSDKKLVTGSETKHTLFSDKTSPYTVMYRDCTGLDQIKSGKFEEIQVTQDPSAMSAGAKIGAGVGAILPGIGWLVGGAVGAAVGAVVDGAKKGSVEEIESVEECDQAEVNATESIRSMVEAMLAKNTGFGTLATKLSGAEKNNLLAQMADDNSLIHNDIIGVYDASIMNSFSGNFNGILFLKDRIYVKLIKSSPKEMMKYADMESITGSLTKRILTGKNGTEIILNGLNYATDDIYQLFAKIIAVVKQN